jgi:hypothetical protein
MSHPPLGIDPNRDPSRLEICPLSDYWQYSYEIRAICQCGSDRYVPTGMVIKLLGERAVMDDRNTARLSKALVCSQCSTRGPRVEVGKAR